MSQVQTFIDDPCPGPQIDHRHLIRACSRLGCRRNIGLRVWLHATMYLKTYSDHAKA